MPGLSQIKKFNEDILSLGDEITLRSSRGEKPVLVPIPKEIEDKDDSEEFVLGMPEIEAEVSDTQVDDDLSDIMGTATSSESGGDSSNAEAAPSFTAPDLSNLLNPVISDDGGEDSMPDFSMFMEPEEEEVVEEEEVKEVSIADMSLDDLLAGTGFDEPEQTEEEAAPEPDVLDMPEELGYSDGGNRNDSNRNGGAGRNEPVEEIEEIQEAEEVKEPEVPDYMADLEADLAAMGDVSPAEDDGSSENIEGLSSDGEADLSSIFGDGSNAVQGAAESSDSETPLDSGSDFDLPENIEPLESSDSFDIPESFEIPEAIETPEELTASDENSAPEELTTLEDFSIPEDLTSPSDLTSPDGDFDLPDAIEPLEDFESQSNETASDAGIDNVTDTVLSDFDLTESVEPEEITEPVSVDDFGLGDNFEMPEVPEELGTDNAESLENLDDLNNDLPEIDNPIEEVEEVKDAGDLGDFGELDTSFDNNVETAEPVDLAGSAGSADDSDFGIPSNLFDASDLDSIVDNGSEGSDTGFDSTGDFSGVDLDNITDESDSSTDSSDSSENADSADTSFDSISDSASDTSSDSLEQSSGADDFGIGSIDFDENNDIDMGTPANLFDSADMDIPDTDFDTDFSDSEEGGDSGESVDGEEGPIEDFDTSEMQGLDFDIPDTDSQLESAKSDFDLGSSDEFPMEGSFEIPGFSDVQTAKEEKSSKPSLSGKSKDNTKSKKAKKNDLDEPDFEGAIEDEKLPPNTLSDAQYKKFLKNLSEYPLNVRLAFEDLIVQDEFTDDAEFEVIEKILEKAPARQVASLLEKMLDTSIPVPRDFEHRTAAEYEAYKKSIAYQLKNKIIPGILMGILIIIVGWGLFNFGKNCIYIPVKANSLYKKGYTLLEANEYPQADMYYRDAADLRLNKKWFFKYARGYRKHKQYQRSEQMYKNILYCFNHDKIAGLEYAGMELDDLADYEKAEEIVRREVLDYHINDADGILMLGDVFLEWGTEKDPDKLELAREQYATLLQLYKSTDLYLSRMMRYFIRTDNLREVLQLKQTFEPREKSLSAEDWTELSGYLLDKSYGPIAPSEEYLRYQIEGLRKLLLRAAHANPRNPIALYNLSRYFVQTNENNLIESTLKDCIEKFNALDSIKTRDIYKYIDSYRLLGEYYIDTTDYLQALEQFAEGILLYTTERDNAGFKGTEKIGKLYEDFGDIKYFISGDYDEALENYKNSVELNNDSPQLRYRIGYIQYKNKNYLEALGSFMKTGESNVKSRNLMLAMANTLSIRGDDYAAQGYYEQLLSELDLEVDNKGLVLPQTNASDYDVVNTYLSAANNYGVTLYRLAKRTGNSALNAQAIVQFSQSVRAWDALTRNQDTLERLSGSNLAEENIKYITYQLPDFEPSIYLDIKKTLSDSEGMN